MNIFKFLGTWATPIILILATGKAGAEAMPNNFQKVEGKVSGFADLSRDGWIDAAIVLPTLTEEQVLSFDFASLLSPKEKMNVGPVDVQVPGNVFVPEQRERYGILPITLKKERFGLFLEGGQAQELFEMSLRLPFSDAVDKVRKKAPPIELIKILKFSQLGYQPARDWTRESSIDLSLNTPRPSTTQISWSREGGAANEVDVAVNLEETSAQRWMLSDLNTQPQASFALKSTAFSGGAKFAFARATFKTTNPKKIAAVRAWIPNHARVARLDISGVPALITDLRWDAPTVLAWNPGDKRGWVTVFRHTDTFLDGMLAAFDISKVLVPDFSSLVGEIRPLEVPTWVRVESGSIVMGKALAAREKAFFIFLGGSGLNDGPQLLGATELQTQNIALGD